MKGQTIVFFSALTFKHLLSGRPAALARAVKKKGVNVIFIEFPASPWGFLRSPFKKKILEFLLPRVQTIDGITVIPQIPLIPFGRLKLIIAMNAVLLAFYIKSILSERIKNSIAIISHPWWYSIIRLLNFRRIYYDCIDDVSVLCIPREIQRYRDWEKELIKISSAVFSISSTLKKYILNLFPHKRVVLLPNGVNVEWFKDKSKEEVKDVLSTGTPIAGYIGCLAPWVDTELIIYCAKQLKDWAFVFIGPVFTSEIKNQLKDIPNVMLMGRRPYNLIPSYINSFDVCLIPFKLDKMGDSSDPIKLYEYLALGKPVVSTNITGLRKLNELVYIGESKEDFVQKMKEAYQNRAINVKKRQEYAFQNSWDARADKLLKEIQNE